MGRMALADPRDDSLFSTPAASSKTPANEELKRNLVTFLSAMQACEAGFLPVVGQPAHRVPSEGGSEFVMQAAVTTELGLAYKRFHAGAGSNSRFLPMASKKFEQEKLTGTQGEHMVVPRSIEIPSSMLPRRHNPIPRGRRVLANPRDNSFFSKPAASPKTPADKELKCDLITFLSAMQACDVDILPVMWQPACGVLGEGGSGFVMQAAATAELGLAFKRFHVDAGSDAHFLSMTSEVWILSQPPIRDHPNIINLEGVCWEVDRRTQEACPVLVFEMAAWNLQQFMKVEEGVNMSIARRLQICADIGSAIMALHSYGVIHGDIKPQNILVFKSATTGETSFKVADFGYSTLVVTENELVSLPKSRPWNAPEHHHGGFKVGAAKKTDVYSFGMLCLWVLFRESLSVSFDIPIGPYRPTPLEEQKHDDRMQELVEQALEVSASLSAEQNDRIREFFSSTLVKAENKRSSDFARLVRLLTPERVGVQPPPTGNTEKRKAISTHAKFQVIRYLPQFVNIDYRVRTHIRRSLRRSYLKHQTQPFAPAIAFQIALCYYIGFGGKSDVSERDSWLEKSNRTIADLDAEKQALVDNNGDSELWALKNERMCELLDRGVFDGIDLISEYRTWGLQRLESVRDEYKREIKDMQDAFGELHLIPLNLSRIFGNLRHELNDYGGVKEMWTHIHYRIVECHGIDHPYFIASAFETAKAYADFGDFEQAKELFNCIVVAMEIHETTVLRLGAIIGRIAQVYCLLGRLKEAAEVGERVLRLFEKVLGEEHPGALTAMKVLSSTYFQQGRWEEAENLGQRALKAMTKVLGREHPNTLDCMGSLALTYLRWGRWQMAEELGIGAVEIAKRALGENHSLTLSTQGALAMVYMSEGRWLEAEELQAKVLEVEENLDNSHYSSRASISMCNLASIYREQGRWKDAEMLQTKGSAWFKIVLGVEHPLTLASVTSLALTYCHQGKWGKAEELLQEVVETSTRLLGRGNPETLIRMISLSTVLLELGPERHQEADALIEEAIEIGGEALGIMHPHLLAAKHNLATTLGKQGHWSAAQELLLSVVETKERIYGREHPDTLAAIGSLATAYRHLASWEEAEELEVRVLEVSELVMGKLHPASLAAASNLALTLWGKGGREKAQELFIYVAESRKKILDNCHPDALESIVDTASMHCDQGRWKEAKEIFIDAIEASKILHGPEHPETMMIASSLVATYSMLGEVEEARELGIQTVEAQRRSLGGSHPKTLHAEVNLSAIFLKEEQWRKSGELLKQTVEKGKEVFCREDPILLTAMAHLAEAYRGQGELRESEDMCLQVKETLQTLFGLEHPSTLTSISNLASTLFSQRRLDEAVKLESQVLESRKKTVGTMHPDTLASMTKLASFLCEQGLCDEAAMLETQVVDIRKSSQGPEHPDTLAAMANLGLTFLAQDQYEEAEKLFEYVMEASIRVLGEDHRDTLAAMGNLASSHKLQGRWETAAELEVPVLAAQHRLFGDKHPDTLVTMNNYSATLYGLGRLREGEDLVTQVIKSRREVLGRRHPSTLDSVVFHVVKLWEQGRQAEAEEALILQYELQGLHI